MIFLGTVVEFIKAKYLVRRSAKLAVIPVRRNFLEGKSTLKWKTYAGIRSSTYVQFESPFDRS